MKKYLISMGGEEQGKNRHNDEGIHRNYEMESIRLFHSASIYFDKMFKYDNNWIKGSSYYRDPKIKLVLDEPSFGWAFKGICILDTLEKADKSDVIMWVDSNHTFVSNPNPIIHFTVQNNIFCHEHWNNYFPNREYTHRDTFIGMNCDEERYWNSKQIQVNVMAFCKNEFTMNFVNEWVSFCMDYDVIIKNQYENLKEFKSHRHEQSIFSILVEKYNLLYQLDPYQIVYEMDVIHL